MSAQQEAKDAARGETRSDELIRTLDPAGAVMLPYPEWLAANGVEPRPACDRWNQGEDNNDE